MTRSLTFKSNHWHAFALVVSVLLFLTGARAQSSGTTGTDTGTSTGGVVTENSSATAASPDNTGKVKHTNDVIPQATGVAGLGGIPGMLNGPAYVEVGGDESHLGGPDAGPGSAWNDFYVRGALSTSGTKNVFNYEIDRQTRFNDSGWFYGGGWTRTLSETWYSEVSAGSSIGGVTIPKLRFDALIHHKVLSRKQLVLNGGFGYDKSKTVNTAQRGQFGGTYYFDRWPLIAEAGMTLTHANPGDILARAQWVSVTEGHDKEHYVSFRYEFGREGYELIQTNSSTAPASLFNFPIHNYSVNWRQWIGLNWGLNLSFQHEGNPNYHRNGGLIGFFLDF